MANDGESDIRKAAAERAYVLAREDALFEPWVRSTIGEPVLVRTVMGDPVVLGGAGRAR